MTLPDADSLSTYGGPYSNYGLAPVDPTTEIDASNFNQMAATVAMSSRMVDRFEASFSWNGTSLALSTWNAVWKAATATAPVLSGGTSGLVGTYTLTLPASVYDELGQSHALGLTSAFGWAEGTTPYLVQASLTSSNVLRVYLFSIAGSLTNATGVVLRVRAK